MIPSIPEHKAQLRRAMRHRLAARTAEARLRDSARICDWIRTAEPWCSAQRVLGFVALPTEPDLLSLLLESAADGRTLCLPRWNPTAETYEAAVLGAGEALRPGPFAVPEPGPSQPVIPLERLDLILIPGLAFDRHGWRLGRGRGFFDRLLRHAVSARRWGVAFDDQLIDQVPNEPHDVNVHILVTPRLGLTATE